MVTVCDYDENRGVLTAKQIVPTFSTLCSSTSNEACEVVVHPSGNYLYAANRSNNNIACFRIHPENGLLTPAGWFSTEGVWPRFFCIDFSGNYLLAANEQSDNISVFPINTQTGELCASVQNIKTPSPTCILLSACYPPK